MSLVSIYFLGNISIIDIFQVAHFSFCDDIRKYKIHVAAWTLDNDYADKEFLQFSFCFISPFSFLKGQCHEIFGPRFFSRF